MPTNRFPKTSPTLWSILLSSGSDTPEGQKALSMLCQAYWFPVYAFIRRRVGSADDALDRTQGFFTVVLARNDLQKFDRKRGTKFRSWLLGCVKHYLSNWKRMEEREKRVIIDNVDQAEAEGRYLAQPSHTLTAERLYDRQFALSVLERALERLKKRYEEAGKGARFEALRGTLSQGTEQPPYAEVAAALGMDVGALRTEASRLRDRYKKELRAEAANLVAHPEDEAEVKEELRQLLAALAEDDDDDEA